MARTLPLSPQEKEILRLMKQGNSIKQVSKKLNISAVCINKYLSHAKERLGLSSGAKHTDAVAKARSLGLL